MKKIVLLFFTSLFIIGCSSVKKTEKALYSGNYDDAITIAIQNLRSKKTKKKKQPYVLMLEEAFAKAVERDMQHIQFLKKDANPANLESIYKTYIQLHDRQERIKPLLPLPLLKKNRNATFNFVNYTNEIVTTKNKLSEYLYANATSLLNSGTTKFDFRKAYEDLRYLEKINSNFRDVRIKIEEAYTKGVDFVMVNLLNDTDKVIPQRLESDLLNFSTYGINDSWTVYHNNPQQQINYDYEMEVAFREINISPEQVKEKQIIKEKQIKDGWKYLYDDAGNPVKDSLGNNIKVDKFKSVSCSFYEFTQFKAVQVTGNVVFKDLNTNQTLNYYPMSSEYIFQHIYADYNGDKRALESDLVKLLYIKPVSFPSNEQMIYDAGEDLKQKLKNIISQHQFN